MGDDGFTTSRSRATTGSRHAHYLPPVKKRRALRPAFQRTVPLRPALRYDDGYSPVALRFPEPAAITSSARTSNVCRRRSLPASPWTNLLKPDSITHDWSGGWLGHHGRQPHLHWPARDLGRHPIPFWHRGRPMQRHHIYVIGTDGFRQDHPAAQHDRPAHRRRARRRPHRSTWRPRGRIAKPHPTLADRPPCLFQSRRPGLPYRPESPGQCPPG